MAKPDEVRADTLDALNTARRKLNSAAFLYQLEDASKADRDAAGKAIVDTALAIQKFRAVRLEAIATELANNNTALVDATKGLRKALDDLQKIKPILDGVAALLKIVARVAALV